MCVITGTLAAIGTGIATAASATASAATAAAASVGSAFMTGASAVGAGLSATGSAIASGASALGSATMSGLSAAGTTSASEAAAAAAGTTSASEAAAATAGMTTAEKIALGAALASGSATGVTQVVQAHEEAKALERQAKNEEVKAGLEQEAGQREAIDAARKAKQERGTGIAQMAANGVMVDDAREGSVPTMYESDLAAELAYDQSKIMYNANLRAWGYRSGAAELRRSARTQRRAGYVSAGLSGLTAGLSAYGGTKTLLS